MSIISRENFSIRFSTQIHFKLRQFSDNEITVTQPNEDVIEHKINSEQSFLGIKSGIVFDSYV